MRMLLVLLMVVPALAVADASKPAPGPRPPAKKAPPPEVIVDFTIKPVVGDKAPTLAIAIANPNKVAVPLTTFAQPGCFAHHYLVITLTGPDGKPAKAAGGCSIRDWPGIETTIAPGKSATIDLPLSALFSPLPIGTYKIGIDWEPAELEKMRPGTGVRASQTGMSGDTFVIAKVLSTFKIERGKSVTLPGGHTLTFGAHGHKRTMVNGPRSPLIISGDIAIDKKPATTFSVSVQTETSRVFKVDTLTFELITWDYDGWMELRYFGALDTTPVATPAPTRPPPPPAPTQKAPPAAKVRVQLSIKPIVGDQPPNLVVTLVNPNKVPVPLTRFDAPACFAHHYLVITLTGPNKKPVKPAAGCAIKDWPGKDETIAPGTSATVELPLSALFSPLPRGTYEISIDWNPAELEKVRPGTGVLESQSSLGGSVFAIAKPLKAFKILPGSSVTLPGGHKLTFRGHGHKSVEEGMTSPLIIRGEITLAKKKKTEFDAHVYPEENRIFDIEGLTFEIGKYEYDGFMELKYFGQLALE